MTTTEIENRLDKARSFRDNTTNRAVRMSAQAHVEMLESELSIQLEREHTARRKAGLPFLSPVR